MCTKGIHGRVSIDTLNRYPLDRHPDQCSVDTCRINSQSIVVRVSTHSYICINWKLVDSWPNVDREIDGGSIESQTFVYTPKKDQYTFILSTYVSLARNRTIFIDFNQNNIEQVVSQMNKALSDIPVPSWWKKTLEVNSVAYTNG